MLPEKFQVPTGSLLAIWCQETAMFQITFMFQITPELIEGLQHIFRNNMIKTVYFYYPILVHLFHTSSLTLYLAHPVILETLN